MDSPVSDSEGDGVGSSGCFGALTAVVACTVSRLRRLGLQPGRESGLTPAPGRYF